MSRFRIVSAIALLLIPGGAYAAADEDLSLASIAAGADARRLTLQALAEGPAGVLAAAAGVDDFPIPCATPLMLPGSTPGPPPEALRRARILLAAVPDLPEERTFRTGEGPFAIHFSAGGASGLPAADRDRDGLPDRVNRIAEALVAARSYLVSGLGYPDPVDPAAGLDVYLVRLGHGLEGVTVSRPRHPDAAAESAGFILLDAALPADRAMAAAMHQFAHLSLSRLAERAAPWWSEATASFLTLAATGDLSTLSARLDARLQAAGRSLASDRLILMQGGLLWPLFLAERTGDAEVVRRIWEEIGPQGMDPLQAADHVLRGAGLTLSEAFREQAVWNLFTGVRDDGRHYSFGGSLPESAMPDVGPGLPLVLGPVEPIESFASVAFRLPADGSRGALDLEVTAEGGRPGADLLLFYRHSGGQAVLVPVVLEDGGVGRVSVPWSEATEAWIVLRNTDPLPEATTRFELRGELDPYAPFDLASFTTRTHGPSVSLEWVTASEKGLVGWNVYRSRRPTGPFTRLNDVAIPAYGDGNTDTGYIFVDGGAGPDRRYYYVLEGITEAGLPERSHLASVRTPPAR